MVDSIINCADPGAADVVIIGAPYDKTSSYGKGAERGPEAIVQCLHRQIEFYERVSGLTPVEKLKIAYQAPAGLQELSPPVMVETLQELYESFGGKLRIILGGEHSVSNAAWRSFAARAGRITIVQIDAHADLREDDTDYSDHPSGKLAHCSVMRRAYELGYNLVQVGVRAYGAAERELFNRERVRVFEWGLKEPRVEQILAAIATEQVYLTIDVDGIDPAFMPATGTPVPGGLSWYYTMELIKNLCVGKVLVGADIVEVAPRLEDRRTEYGAAQLCYTLIGCWLLKASLSERRGRRP